MSQVRSKLWAFTLAIYEIIILPTTNEVIYDKVIVFYD